MKLILLSKLACSVSISAGARIRPQPNRYNCHTQTMGVAGAAGLNRYTFTLQHAMDTMREGNITKRNNGFPHHFGGIAGDPPDHPDPANAGGGLSGLKLKFPGGDPRCAQPKVDYFEYPIVEEGFVDRNDRKTKPTPARVVYLKDGTTFCGVMTHVLQDKDGVGEGDFRVCELVHATR